MTEIERILEASVELRNTHEANISYASGLYKAGKEYLNAEITKHCPLKVGDIVTIPFSAYRPYSGRRMRVDKIGYHPFKECSETLSDAPYVFGMLMKKNRQVGKVKTFVSLRIIVEGYIEQSEEKDNG